MQRRLSLRVPAISAEDLFLDDQVCAAIDNATRQIVCHGAYINADGEDVYLEDAQERARQQTIVYTPHQLVPQTRPKYPAVHCYVYNQTTLTVAHERTKLGYRTAIVHCGSVNSAGLAVHAGCRESVHRSSSLSYCLDGLALGSGRLPNYRDDTIVVAPQVPVFRGHDGDLLRSPWYADVVTTPPIETIPAPLARPDRHAELPLLMVRRAQRLIEAAAATGANVLVLGVWGCAEHVQNHELTATAFRAALEQTAARAFAIVDVAAADPSTGQRVLQTYTRRLDEHVL